MRLHLRCTDAPQTQGRYLSKVDTAVGPAWQPAGRGPCNVDGKRENGRMRKGHAEAGVKVGQLKASRRYSFWGALHDACDNAISQL